ncbi:MAG TPA: YbhN family protein [Pirellulales bacterium]
MIVPGQPDAPHEPIAGGGKAPLAAARRRLMTAVKLALVVVLIWGIHRTLSAAADQLHARHWSPAQLRPGWLAAAMGLYLLGLLPSALFWHRILVAMGQQAALGETLRAYFIGHLGKYVPGKALVVVLRTGLIRSHRVDGTVAAVSVFYETLTMMAVGACVAAVILAVGFSQHIWFVGLAAILVLAAGLPTHPAVFRRLVARLRRGRSSERVLAELSQLNYRTLAVAWLAIAGGWCLIGLSLWATLVAGNFAQWPLSGHDAGVCIASAALAVVAGFLSLIPGGAGVREAVLIELLQPSFGADGAVISAIVARVAWLAAELLVSALLYVAGWRHQQRGSFIPPERIE